MVRTAASFLVCVWMTSCAPVTRLAAPMEPLFPVAELSAADRLVQEGCYRCLLQALEVFERAADSDRTFATTLLLALREKEIGLEAISWIEKARAAASPADAPYVDIVSSQPWTTVGAAYDFAPPPRVTAVQRENWEAFLRRSATPSLLDRYLLIALGCRRSSREEQEPASTETPPLLQYRLGLCGPSHRASLDSAFAASPRFVETGLFLAREEMTNREAGSTRVSRALPLLIAAHDGIPESPLISVTLAGVWVARKEYARALALYDHALASRPEQRDALLGRAIVLTYLGRGDEAIDAATRMIELGTWYLGDAFYWRAWNLYSSGRIAAADKDVVSARRYQSSGELLTLAGMIAYEQQQRDEARRDFTDALRLNPANCPALWYLGLLAVDEQDWANGREYFAESTGCYSRAATAIEREEIPTDLSAEASVQQREDRARRLADNRRQIARSSLNAALLSAQIGDRETAVRFAQLAATHDLTRERAETILRRDR